MSLPTRGAWIEILLLTVTHSATCRSPRGERGLKCGNLDPQQHADASLPTRGAWIEILQ